MHIISGSLKGRVIKTNTKQAQNEGFRPTTNYAKQVLFNLLANNNTIQTEVEGKTVLDAFAGSGAVGFEFASRGASHVVFVDSDLENIKQLKITAASLGLSITAIGAFLPDVSSIRQKFDIIFADPPYNEGKGKVAQTIKNMLAESLEDEGIIILEILNTKRNLEEYKKHFEKKNITQNLVYTRDAGSKTIFLFFKIIANQNN